jgi:CheY-like chemotaxis protein
MKKHNPLPTPSQTKLRKKAEAKLKKSELLMILMDIQMPVMDGITATQKIKKKFKNPPPIVGLSASAFEGDREKYLSLGMDDYLTKPVNIVEFQQLIGRL